MSLPISPKPDRAISRIYLRSAASRNAWRTFGSSNGASWVFTETPRAAELPGPLRMTCRSGFVLTFLAAANDSPVGEVELATLERVGTRRRIDDADDLELVEQRRAAEVVLDGGEHRRPPGLIGPQDERARADRLAEALRPRRIDDRAVAREHVVGSSDRSPSRRGCRSHPWPSAAGRRGRSESSYSSLPTKPPSLMTSLNHEIVAIASSMANTELRGDFLRCPTVVASTPPRRSTLNQHIIAIEVRWR
jgi:hypothetical protein